ncbi:MAG TPA: hypothetical protein PLV92_21965, partial [Pirellulaceae bacterium]|nr:hypothetical protein [Pirellulaceae bacterium]
TTVKPQSGKTDRDAFTTPFSAKVRIGGTSWVAVRTFEQQADRRVRFAHSAPVHFIVPERPIAPRQAEREYLIARTKAEIERNRPVVGPDALQEFETALRYYERLPVRAD